MSQQRIIHGPYDIASGAQLFAKAQQQMGLNSKSACYAKAGWRKPDIELPTDQNFLEKVSGFLKITLSYDVFHFWFGGTFWGTSYRELSILKKMKKKMFFHFCGCDIRDEKHMISTYDFSACMVCLPKLCSLNNTNSRAIAEEFGSKVFVSTPDLMHGFKDPVLIPQPIDEEYLELVKSKFISKRDKRDKLIIAHAPSSLKLKGSSYLIEAVKSLEKKGYPVELRLITGKSHMDALHSFMDVDLGVDQLLAGAYGTVGAELMYLGVPVINYMNPAFDSYYEEAPPLITANPISIEQVIKDCLDGRIDLNHYSQRSTGFSRNYHSPEKLVKKMEEFY